MSSHVSELSVIGAKGNMGPYGREKRFFFDLDTSHFVNGWPKELTREDSSPETVEAAREWASKQEADLMCVERANEDGTISCTLVGIGLELWELSQYYDHSTLELFVNSGKLPPGRKVNGDHLLHLDSDSGRELPQRNTSFLYVTRDQGLGLISIRGFVSKAQIDSGAPASEGQASNSQIQFENTIIAR